MTYATCETYDTLDKETRAFESCRDRWNRQIGVLAIVTRQEWVESDKPWGYPIEPGVWYEAYVQQTRNSETYGASYFLKRFRSLEEALAAKNEVVAKRQKEYTKKYGQK